MSPVDLEESPKQLRPYESEHPDDPTADVAVEQQRRLRAQAQRWPDSARPKT